MVWHSMFSEDHFTCQTEDGFVDEEAVTAIRIRDGKTSVELQAVTGQKETDVWAWRSNEQDPDDNDTASYTGPRVSPESDPGLSILQVLFNNPHVTQALLAQIYR